LAKVSVLLHPFMPKTTQTIAKALGFAIDHESYTSLIKEAKLLDSFTIEKVPPLFPRIEEPLVETPAEKAVLAQIKKSEEKKSDKEDESGKNLITIDKFFEVSLKVGTVLEAQEVPKSKKLLKLQVDLGESKPRQIVAGIKEWYSPDNLVGTQVCVVANLKPAKLMGLVSEGMILAAKDDDGLALIRPEKPKKAGTSIG
ncbi:MAG: methionine--tRNA ligase subunit beta, partial [Hydrogenimonas sp.]|nr:methionine--tRNA ligase subunit beta [Hydrogenimonas sp.]